MAVYTQGTFILVCGVFWLVAGDGRYAEGLESESLIFLLRAWTWPAPGDWPLFLFLGLLSGLISYSLAQAYRSADAASIAPFEYVAMPLAILWGWLVFGDLPDAWVLSGAALIAASGIYVFLREKQRARPNAARRPRGRA
jgi:S-adenosylmethionine uptake transporter